jgi:hypothetical protein
MMRHPEAAEGAILASMLDMRAAPASQQREGIGAKRISGGEGGTVTAL